MTAVLAMARASDIAEALVVEFMPALETVLVEAYNQDPEDNGREAGFRPDQG